MMGAPWVMKVVVILRSGTRRPRVERKSRVRVGEIGLIVCEIALLGLIACCSLLSAFFAREDMRFTCAEAAVPAMMWRDARPASLRIHAPDLSSSDRRRFLREMMVEWCA
ncbi:hypothetical protein ACE10Z_36890 [Bradyrhizobium sp. Pha-3]|uniref:hypothetical protein n=1 Tax=Bradyrhizobium sp. Pha-3 TaxID=208375 RepID=UPI0035D403E0